MAAILGLRAKLRSEDFRQAVRVALAMVIAYYIALSMGWDRPHWAGLAVAVCSLATVGDSLNKGLLRILGTFLAGFVVLLLIGLFPQDRWSYMLGATVHIAICTYMMGHSSRWYFWSIAGAVMPTLALAGGPEGATAFGTVVLRLQETAMGVIVYTTVAVVLWPRRGAASLTRTIGDLVETQRLLLELGMEALTAKPGNSEALKLRLRAVGIVAGLPAMVDGARLDSFEVWETRHLWQSCANDFGVLNEVMERWRQGFPDLQKLELRRLIPGLPAFCTELVARLAAVTRMLASKPPHRWPEEVALDFNEGNLNTVSRFDRAALVRSRDQLLRMDELTRSLVSAIADIRGFDSNTKFTSSLAAPNPPRAIDLDRLASVVRSFTAVWVILLACLYIPDFPMPTGVIPVAATVAIQLALMPEVSLRTLIVPSLAGITFGGAFHILVMPHLGSFVGLGIGIFIGIFLICFLLAKPKQAIARSLGLSTFVMLISVKNEQTYNFLVVVNFALMLQLALVAVAISTWFPISFDPSKVIFKQLSRFMRSCDWLASRAHRHTKDHLWWSGAAFHIHEVMTLPGKIGRWVAAVPVAAHGWGSPAAARDLVDSLQAFGDRIRQLAEASEAPQSEAMTRELVADMHDWRAAIREVLHRLAFEPASVDVALLRPRLDAKMEALELRIENALNVAPKGSASPEEIDNMYRLLGAYRGASEALLELAQRAAQIDWARLREARF